MPSRWMAILATICTLQSCRIFVVFAEGFEEHQQQGPEFGPMADSVTVTEGQTIYLDCLVKRRGDKTITWSKHHADGGIELISYGRDSFHDDRRFSLKYELYDNWRLRLIAARRSDEGIYECQVSTHPPIKKTVWLKVIDPQITIQNSNNENLENDFYVKEGSTLNLRCIMAPMSVYSRKIPYWLHNGIQLTTINSNRISIDQMKSDGDFTVALTILRVTATDAGIFTCKLKGVKQGKSFKMHVISHEISSSTVQVNGSQKVSPLISYAMIFKTVLEIIIYNSYFIIKPNILL